MNNKKWKVFGFAINGYSYAVKSETKEDAKKFLLDEHDVNIPNCFEIPESEWDNQTVKMYEDNNMETEPFYISLREAFNNNATELLATSDINLFD